MEEGLLFIEQTLQHLLPGISESDFNENYWKPSQQAIEFVIVQSQQEEIELIITILDNLLVGCVPKNYCCYLLLCVYNKLHAIIYIYL